MTVLCINISLGLISRDFCTKKFRDEFQIGGMNVTGSRYNITHFYSLAVEFSFYSDFVECLPVDPETWGQFPAGTCKLFSLHNKCNNLKCRNLT